MDVILLGITIVSLVVALVMSVAAWRMMSDEKKRSAARVAALSVAAGVTDAVDDVPLQIASDPKPPTKAPWSSPRVAPMAPVAPATPAAPVAAVAPALSHASGFLGAAEVERDSGGRQRSLAFAAVILFVILSGGLAWMMSGPRGTSAVAVGPNSPLELVSLSHARQNDKLAVSGLVRNPASGEPVERLSAVVFLFDRAGTFVTSSRANVDFLKLGAGDESPFVVSLDAPPTVARYRVSFRTDDGIVPHIDRRASPAAAEGEQPVNVTLK
jgi:hypothetical protein